MEGWGGEDKTNIHRRGGKCKLLRKGKYPGESQKHSLRITKEEKGGQIQKGTKTVWGNDFTG